MSSTISARTQDSFALARAAGNPAARQEYFYASPVAAPTRKDLGQRIAEWRAERGLDQEAFGALIGKSQRTVSAIEGGAVTLTVLLTTMGKLGKSLSDLEPAEKRLGRPVARPPAEGATIPLDLHEAALRALQEAQARLAAYAGHSEIADDDIGPDTGRGGSTRPEPEPPGQGSGSNAGHPPPRRKKKP